MSERSVPEEPAPDGSMAVPPAPEAALPEPPGVAGLDVGLGGGASRDAFEPADPEWLLIVVRVEAGDAAADGGEARFALVRRGEGAPLELLGVAAPGPFEGLDQVVGDALTTRLGLEPAGAVLLSERRIPRRAAQWRVGRVATGWERAAAVRAVGVPLAVPPLLEAELLPLAEAEAALATSVERELLREGARLL